jgi:MFS family permease
LIYVTALSALFAVAMALVFGLLVSEVLPHLWVLVILGLALVLEQAAIGMSIGARFPDFRESIRSRYVSVWGSLLGVFLGLIIGILTISPVFFSVLLYHEFLDQFAVLGVALGLIVFILAWRIAEKQVETLLGNIRV